MAMVAAKCTMCGSSIKVDDSKEKGVCEHCGTEFITEKVINVTNITNVDKSTNIYYGETTDAKIKKDLEKAYKTLELSGCDLINLTLGDNNLDEELCQNAYTLAKGVTKKDPTNYGGWKCMILATYIPYFAGELEWIYNVEKFESYKDILAKLLKDIATAKKVAPNAEEKKYMDTLSDNLKINHYQNQLPAYKDLKEFVNYVEKPQLKEVLLSKVLPWVGGWIALMGLVLLFNNLLDLKLSFIPEGTPTVMAIMLILVGAVIIGIFLYKFIAAKRSEKQIKDADDENKKRYADKKAEYDNDIASAKTLKDWEALADKYKIEKI